MQSEASSVIPPFDEDYNDSGEDSKKRKRSNDEEEDDDNNNSSSSNIVENNNYSTNANKDGDVADGGDGDGTATNTVTFSLAGIHEYLICELCNGYYREPYAISDCLHTFCKSCLFYGISCGCYECPNPKCKVYLGTDPLRLVKEKSIVADRGLQEFIDKIVFPDITHQEECDEEEFYNQRGISMKPQFAQKKQKKVEMQRSSSNRKMNNNGKKKSPGVDDPSNSNKSTITTTNNSVDSSSAASEEEEEVVSSSRADVTFTLLPEVTTTTGRQQQLPFLKDPCLKISGKFQICQLKKYLQLQLGVVDDDSSISSKKLDVMCNGVTLGDEMNLSFVKRLLWHQENVDMGLTYKLAEEKK